MQNSYLLAISALALSGISTLQASTINNSTGLFGVSITPSAILTFDNAPGLSTNSVITNQFAFSGVTFSSPAYYDGNSAGFGCSGLNQSGDCVTNYTSSPTRGLINGPSTPFSILFSIPQSYAAFALVTDASGNNNTTITALRNGVQVDQGTFTTSTTQTNNYYVFYNETTPFDQLRISTTGSNLVILDNLQLQSTPEPGTIGLLSAGLLGVVVAARRRRRSA